MFTCYLVCLYVLLINSGLGLGLYLRDFYRRNKTLKLQQSRSEVICVHCRGRNSDSVWLPISVCMVVCVYGMMPKTLNFLLIVHIVQ